MSAVNRWAGVLLAVAVSMVVTASPASADPSSDWQLPQTAGVHTALDSLGAAYPYVTLSTGGRWYLECPLEPTKRGPGGTELKPSIPLDTDHDRCGNDEGANASAYPGATWTTSTFASVNVDPNDVRCGQLVAHRVDANPPDAVGPVFCTPRVLLYPTMNPRVAGTLARWWPSQVLDSCPQTTDLQVRPHSGLRCAGWSSGDFKNDDREVSLQWWHHDRHNGVDCDHIPAGHIPPPIAAWAQGSQAALLQACQAMNNFFSAAVLSFAPTTGLLAAVRAALAESGPDKKPPWLWAVCCGDVEVHTDTDWQAVIATVGGCLVGGLAGAAAGGPAGAVIGCAAGGYAASAANNWLESQDCALTSWHCIVNAVSRWAAHGFVSELQFGLHQLTHGLAPQTLFGQDAFIRMWQALALVSAMLVALYALGAAATAMGTLRPSIVMSSVRNIVVWGWALVAALPVTTLLLDAADGVTTFICTWAGTHGWQGLADRFQAVVAAALNNSFPSSQDATVSILLLLLVVVGALAALWLAAWAFIRAAAIALSVLGIPLSAAALAGPPRWRRAPQVALSTLLGLILFKPLVAVVFVLGIGLMGTGSSLGAFLVGVVCVLAAAFAPRQIIRLLGAGIDSVAHGEAAHASITTGPAATVIGAQQLYRMGRGRWSSSGHAAGAGPVSPRGVGTPGGGAGQATATGTPPTLPSRQVPTSGESHPGTAPATTPPTAPTGRPVGVTTSGGGAAPARPTSPVRPAEQPSLPEIVNQHRAGDR